MNYGYALWFFLLMIVMSFSFIPPLSPQAKVIWQKIWTAIQSESKTSQMSKNKMYNLKKKGEKTKQLSSSPTPLPVKSHTFIDQDYSGFLVLLFYF